MLPAAWSGRGRRHPGEQRALECRDGLDGVPLARGGQGLTTVRRAAAFAAARLDLWQQYSAAVTELAVV